MQAVCKLHNVQVISYKYILNLWFQTGLTFDALEPAK